MTLPDTADTAPPDTAAGDSAGPDSGWRRLDLRMIWVDLVRSVASTLPAVVAVTVFDVEVGWSTLWPQLIVATIGILVAVADALRWAKTRYRVTAELVQVRTGFLVRKYRSIRRERIRSVDATARLRHRITGMRILRIGTGDQTFGSPEPALELDAVSAAEAAALRKELSAGIATDQVAAVEPVPETAAATAATEVATAGLPAASEPGPPPVRQSVPADSTAGAVEELARIRWSWIVHNLFNVWAYLVAFGLLWGAFWLFGSFGVDVRGILLGLLNPERFGLLPSVLLATVALGLLGAVGLACTFVAENWNFRLLRVRTGAGTMLRTSRGLFSTREIDRDEARLRGVQLSEPLLWRWMGMADTDVISTGLSVWTLDPATTVLPRGPVSVARRVAARILGSEVLSTRLRPHPPAALRRRLVRTSAVLAALAALATAAAATAGEESAWLPGWLPWLVLGVAPFGYGLTYVGYRALGHALAEDHLLFRSGTVARATAVLRRQAVVGWVFRQSVLQRRLGLMTVGATTAAGYGEYAAPDADQRDAVRLAVAATPELFGCTDGRVTPAGAALPIDVRATKHRTSLGWRNERADRGLHGRRIRP